MTYSIRATAISYSATTTVSITIPATVQTGDLMLLAVCGDGVATTPTGWTQVVNETSWVNSSGYKGMAAVKTAVSGDAGSTVNVSTTGTTSYIGLAATQGPVAYQGINGILFDADTTTASQSFPLTTSSGDLILMFGAAFITGSTFNYTSANGTVTVDRRDTTSTGISSAVGHAAASTGTSTQIVASYTPTGSHGFLSFQWAARDFKATASAGGAATVNFPLKVTGVTATSTTTAAAATAITRTAPAGVIATTTPKVTVSVDTATITLTDAALILIADDAAEVSGLTQTGYIHLGGTKVGDDFGNPIVVSGAGTQTVTVDFAGATIQDGEPNPVWDPPVAPPAPGTFLQATMWIRYTPLLNGTLTISGATAADDYELEIFDGDSLDSLTRADTSYFSISPGTLPPPLTYDVTANSPVYIRAWASGYGWQTSPFATTLTLAFVEDASQQGALVLDVITPTFSTSPGVIRVNVVGGTPTSDLAFDLLGTTTTYANPPGIALGSNVATYTADTSGNLYGATIPLPTVSAGTYTIRVRDTTAGTSVTDSVQVDADPITPPGTIAPDNPIGTVTNGTTVKSWTFKDPAPSGLGVYAFPINPVTMTTPHAPRNVTIEHTVALAGHPLIWEGAYRANEWKFQGTVITQGFYDTLVAYAQLNRRFWITDHRNRAWVCSIEAIDWTKKRAPYNDWAWDYDVTALIFDGPVTLP